MTAVEPMIGLANMVDLERITAILAAASARLHARGIDQWRRPFPQQRLADGIAAGEVFITALDGVPVATWRLLATDPGIWPDDDDEALYLHTLAVDPIYSGRGLGAAAIAWCQSEVLRRGRDWLRLDCMAANPGLNRFYAGLGFIMRDTRLVDGFTCRRWELAVTSPPMRGARPTDLDSVMALVGAVVADLRAKEIEQWDEVYPGRECIAHDLAVDNAMVALDEDRLVAFVALNQEQSAEYASGSWQLRHPAVIHRLMVHPVAQGRGLAKHLMAWAESAARARGYDSIRLDAFQSNQAAMRLYDRLGYRRCGEVRFRKGMFALFEKALS
jgi:ribosomal protein S18 acetylase RimI-like enzyme